MKNSSSQIIYIGKAKNLKNRVSSYFTNVNAHPQKVAKMVQNVADFDYIVVDSEFEALVLECSLIKQNSPKYNILLKDDKGYHYIKISNEPYPRITAEKQKPSSDIDHTFIGPFTSSFSVTQTVDSVNHIFGLPTCKKKFPRDFNKARPCLNYHIKQCSGICKGEISQSAYNDSITLAIDYIKKGDSTLSSSLAEQMQIASDNLDFERAVILRDRIRAIQKITESQKVYNINISSLDVVAFAYDLNFAVMTVLQFRNSSLCDKIEFTFNNVHSLEQLRSQALSQFYLNNVDIPHQIMVDNHFDDLPLLADYLSDKQKRSVKISVPKRGDNFKLVSLAHKNATDKLSKQKLSSSRLTPTLEQLRDALALKHTPIYIEAYDISNLGNDYIVGGMVVFKNGLPHKKAYKKFKIKHNLGQDDYASMSEVLTRRLSHLLDPTEKDECFAQRPDLILLDGGQGHVSVVSEVLAKLQLDIPVFGMVKDSSHKTRAIAKNHGEIEIASNHNLFSLITKIQDEVHRYSINYQRKLHKKSTFEVSLTRVSGIGDKKASDILKHFSSKQLLKQATVEELMSVAKINHSIATELHQFIQQLL